MGTKTRRSNIKHGKYSLALVPANIKKGNESTLAANRLVLIDPRAEIHEEDLLEFLETYIEPQFWPWYQKKKQNAQSKGAE